jgi:hypothetical protein
MSVSSTVRTQLSTGLHRNFTSYILGVALIILWVASPLGSQSVLRISSLVPVDFTTSASALYMDSNNWDNLPPGGSDAFIYSNGADIVFNAVLASSITFKEGVKDVWGHVKIPKWSRTSASEEDPEGWRPVNITSLDDYSSLFGLPVEPYAYSTDQSLDLTVESWYWNLACGQWAEPVKDPAETFAFNATYLGPNYGAALIIFYNLTGMYGQSDYRVTRPTCTFEFPHQSSNGSAECAQLPARRFKASLPHQLLENTCDISTEYVETHITCTDGECLPKRMRQSRQPHPHQNWTMFDVQAGGSATVLYGASLTNQGAFWNNLVRVLAGKPFSSGDALVGYILRPAQPFFADGNQDLRGGLSGGATVPVPKLLDVEDPLITSRFAQIVNSYYMASIGNMLITASQATWQDTLKRDKELILESGGSITNATRSTSITVTTPRPRFICSLPWLLLFTAVTVLSLVSAVIGLVLTLQIKGPRLGMNFTTMLRDSRYSDLGPNGSYMDDGDRLRESRETRVVIGDVVPNEAVGHIAVSTMASDGLGGSSSLTKGRLYE